MKKIYFFIFLFAGVISLQAQNERYIDEVFTEVNVTSNVSYSTNATVLLYPVVGEAVPEVLKVDIYSPSGDTETSRPLVLIAHSGNFLPFPDNQNTSGTMTDMTPVEIANRLAKKGYVAAIFGYRKGWNPLGDQTERISTLINAAYRGIQDARTCNRFFRKTAAEDGNPYGIDPSKISIFGIGTGGYIAQGCGHLDDYNEVLLPKFIVDTPNGPLPMVIEIINGGIDGNGPAADPTAYGINPLDGDTLNYPDAALAAYSSEFAMTSNLGGALGDKSWIDENSTPQVSFHVPTDPFAPCNDGIVTVPVLELPVVDVTGSCGVLPLMNDLGLNDAMVPDWSPLDNWTIAANMNNGGAEGLMLFLSDDPTESAPWDMYLSTNQNATTPPDNPAAMIYIDSIMGYWAPRACRVMNLGCTVVSNNNISDQDVNLTMAPNPASEQINLTADMDITDVFIYDLQGRLVQAHAGVDAPYFQINRNNLSTGMYIAELKFAEGVLTKKIVFE